MSEQVTNPNRNTQELINVLRKMGEFRRELNPGEQVAFDYIVRSAVKVSTGTDVQGYGLGSWLQNAMSELVRLLSKPYENADEAEMIAYASAWGLA